MSSAISYLVVLIPIRRNGVRSSLFVVNLEGRLLSVKEWNGEWEVVRDGSAELGGDRCQDGKVDNRAESNEEDDERRVVVDDPLPVGFADRAGVGDRLGESEGRLSSEYSALRELTATAAPGRSTASARAR